jgi:nitrate reductase (cytochrome), electron transfer subunit
VSTTDDGGVLFRRVVAITAAAAAMVALILLLAPLVVDSDTPPPPPRLAGEAVPIAAEADVFRTRPGDLAIEPGAARRPEAHARTLAMYRSLREYPGAPPRIPHGLTADEFRGTQCNSCHERGGYVARLSSYAPVTPHPDLADCLQCHVPDDRLVGIELPAAPGGDAVCLQCHVPGEPPPMFAEVDWRAPTWPATGQQALPDAPPLMPHDLHLRGNCLACHMAPAAVEEIRTPHPERANCRQCHIPAGSTDAGDATDDVFTRPLDGGVARTGGGT